MGRRSGRRLVVPLPGDERLGRDIANRLACEVAAPMLRRFPDEETYVRLDVSAEQSDAELVATLDRPDSKFLSLCFLADLLRELGAQRLILVAPYLAYLRQDTRFEAGEAVKQLRVPGSARRVRLRDPVQLFTKDVKSGGPGTASSGRAPAWNVYCFRPTTQP